MLRQVISIKNVGRFRNSAATPNPAFAKHTFIFGGNGFGKTTFSVVMWSAQSGDAAPVLGRQTLGSSQAPERSRISAPAASEPDLFAGFPDN